jgi:hypothetical protein
LERLKSGNSTKKSCGNFYVLGVALRYSLTSTYFGPPK